MIDGAFEYRYYRSVDLVSTAPALKTLLEEIGADRNGRRTKKKKGLAGDEESNWPSGAVREMILPVEDKTKKVHKRFHQPFRVVSHESLPQRRRLVLTYPIMYNAVLALISNPAFNRLFLTNAGCVFETPSFCTLAKLTATVTCILALRRMTSMAFLQIQPVGDLYLCSLRYQNMTPE
jgi:hypothetical protein